MRNVHDFSRLLGGAQGEIVILRQVEFLTQTAERKGKLAAVGAQMTDIHERVEQFGTPFRFKEWFRPFPRFAQAIFVTVKDVGSRPTANRTGQFIKCEGREHIIMINQGNEIAGGDCRARFVLSEMPRFTSIRCTRIRESVLVQRRSKSTVSRFVDPASTTHVSQLSNVCRQD